MDAVLDHLAADALSNRDYDTASVILTEENERLFVGA